MKFDSNSMEQYILGQILLAPLAIQAILKYLCDALDVDRIARRSLVTAGFYASVVGGILGAPFVIALLTVHNRRYGTHTLGLEILYWPTVGAILFAIFGAIAGAIHGFCLRRQSFRKGSPPLWDDSL